MLPRLDEVWQNLPLQVQQRFRAQEPKLYDEMHADVRAHAYTHRLTSGSVKVWSEEREQLVGVDAEGYVANLLRAVRNSAHSFIHVLTNEATRWDRAILGAHDGHLPSELADVVALLGFALVAVVPVGGIRGTQRPCLAVPLPGGDSDHAAGRRGQDWDGK